MRFWRDMGLAFSTLTGLPTRARWPEDGRTQVAAFYPWVGLVLGLGALGLAALATESAAAQPLLPAALIVFALAAVTRFLHFDGLADVADAWFVAPERRLDVMRDSAVGAFGATAIVFVALLQTAALAALIQNAEVGVVLLVPLFGRFAATFGAWLGRPARPDGLGASVTGRPTLAGIVVAVIPAAVASGALIAVEPRFGIATSVLGLLLALTVPHAVAERFGGVTGDVLGASVLITETVVLVLTGFATIVMASSVVPFIR